MSPLSRGFVVAALLCVLGACQGAGPRPGSDQEAGRAAVRAFYDDLNAAIGGGAVAPVLARTTPTCTCRGLAQFVTESWRAGSLRGGKLTAQPGSITVADRTATVDVTVASEPLEVLDGHGEVVRRIAADSWLARVTLVGERGRWLVSNAQRVDHP